MIRKLTIFLLCILVSSLGFASSSTAEDLAQLLASYKTFQANFIQLTYMGNSSSPRKTVGRVMMMRPGKFRWETKKPINQTIIANGETLWIYDAELQQATQQTVSNTAATNPAALLSGDVSTLIKQYTISKINRRGAVWFQLTPKSKDSSFTLVQMQFLKGRLENMWLKNNLGQASRFHFYNIHVNVHLNEDLFIFKLPPGADLLKQ